jgi:hypothetical protein
MPSPVLSRQDATQDCEVIRFCTAAGKEHLFRTRTNESCHTPSRLFNRIACLQTFAMETRWIAKNVGEKRPHGVPDDGV